MKTGLLAMAMLPVLEPATMTLPTLIWLDRCQEPIPKRLRQPQSPSWPRSGHARTPWLMKTGLLAMATFPLPEPATVRLPTLMVLGRNHTPFRLRFCQNQLLSWLRRCQNQSSWPNRFRQLHSPWLMKTGLLATARLPVLPRLGDANQRPARLPSRLHHPVGCHGSPGEARSGRHNCGRWGWQRRQRRWF